MAVLGASGETSESRVISPQNSFFGVRTLTWDPFMPSGEGTLG